MNNVRYEKAYAFAWTHVANLNLNPAVDVCTGFASFVTGWDAATEGDLTDPQSLEDLWDEFVAALEK